MDACKIMRLIETLEFDNVKQLFVQEVAMLTKLCQGTGSSQSSCSRSSLSPSQTQTRR